MFNGHNDRVQISRIGGLWADLARILSDITETEAQSVLHSYDMMVQGKYQTITVLNDELEYMEKVLSKTKRDCREMTPLSTQSNTDMTMNSSQTLLRAQALMPT